MRVLHINSTIVVNSGVMSVIMNYYRHIDRSKVQFDFLYFNESAFKYKTYEEEIKKMVNEGKAVFYIGFDPTADSLHVGHFMALCLMKRLQMAGNRPVVLVGGGTGYIGPSHSRYGLRAPAPVSRPPHLSRSSLCLSGTCPA